VFLTEDQVRQLQGICEDIAGRRTRSGRVIIEIHNNMPRSFLEEIPVYNEDHVLIGYTTQIIRCQLPAEEIERGRQKNRMPGKRGEDGKA